MLDRESILKKRKLAIQKVNVPQWDGDVYVREMTGEDRDWLDSQMYNPETKDISLFNAPNARATIACLVLCDADGNKLFTKHDVGMLSAQPSAALEIVMKAGLAVNGLTDSSVEDAEKNSDADTSDRPGSA